MGSLFKILPHIILFQHFSRKLLSEVLSLITSHQLQGDEEPQVQQPVQMFKNGKKMDTEAPSERKDFSGLSTDRHRMYMNVTSQLQKVSKNTECNKNTAKAQNTEQYIEIE